MAARIATQSLRVAARSRVTPAVYSSARSMATQPSPEDRASELVEKLPSSPNLITKTGTALLGAGTLAAAISQELYVLNEETVLGVGSLILFTYIAKAVRKPYVDWAEGHIDRVRSVLNQSRAEHTQAVKDRIESVGQMKDVVNLTEGLFEVSKDTAQIEADNFVASQKVALASEIKGVLDSWVRYEQQQKESEQAELVKSVIDKVMSGLKDEKTQKDILLGALAEIDQLVKNKAI